MTVRIADDLSPTPWTPARGQRARADGLGRHDVTPNVVEEPYEAPVRTGSILLRPDPGTGIVTKGNGYLSRMLPTIASADRGTVDRMHQATGRYLPRGRNFHGGTVDLDPTTELRERARRLGVELD